MAAKVGTLTTLANMNQKADACQASDCAQAEAIDTMSPTIQH